LTIDSFPSNGNQLFTTSFELIRLEELSTVRNFKKWQPYLSSILDWISNGALLIAGLKRVELELQIARIQKRPEEHLIGMS
tara:strand:+ start:869 stop:1111 length:243 start_codon:yes stop_codon:yes gene_type:complete